MLAKVDDVVLLRGITDAMEEEIINPVKGTKEVALSICRN
jgi:hypothetical protein